MFSSSIDEIDGHIKLLKKLHVGGDLEKIEMMVSFYKNLINLATLYEKSSDVENVETAREWREELADELVELENFLKKATKEIASEPEIKHLLKRTKANRKSVAKSIRKLGPNNFFREKLIKFLELSWKVGTKVRKPDESTEALVKLGFQVNKRKNWMLNTVADVIEKPDKNLGNLLNLEKLGELIKDPKKNRPEELKYFMQVIQPFVQG